MSAFRQYYRAAFISLLSLAALGADRDAAGAAKRYYAPPRVYRHAVHVERWNAFAVPASSSTVFAGAVITVPGILEAPSGVAFDSDNLTSYVLDSRQSAGLTVVVQIVASGATRLIATLPVSVARHIVYASSLEKFFVTYTQSSSLPAPGILSVDLHGHVAFIAGGGGFGQVDGTGSAASFSENLSGITFDPHNGSLYADDGDRIRAITPSGVVTTLTAPGSLGGTFPNGGGGVAYSGFNDMLYVADAGTASIKQVALTTGFVTTFAGQCLSVGFYGCDPLQRDGQGPDGLFGSPSDIVVDSQAQLLYVADSANASVRRIDAAGNVSTLAGNGVPAHLDGAGQSAEFTSPSALTINPVNHMLAVVDLPPNNSFTTLPSFRFVRTVGLTPPPAKTPITLFDPVSLDPLLYGISWLHTANPPATLVYDAFTASGGVIGQIAPTGIATEQTDPLASIGIGIGGGGGPFDVRYASDDTQWTFENSDLLGHRSLAGAISGVTIGTGAVSSGDPGQLAAGPNGSMWFVVPQTGVVGQAAPNGTVSSFVVSPVFGSYSASIAFASSGNPWIATNNQLIELGPTGLVKIDDAYAVREITTGPDGNIWFTQSDAVGTIRSDNTIVVYPIFAPVPGCPALETCSRNITAIAAGPDGALWVTETGAVARLTTGGVFSEFPVLAARTAPSAISPGPDGNVWFLDAGAKKIGRLTISPR